MSHDAGLVIPRGALTLCDRRIVRRNVEQDGRERRAGAPEGCRGDVVSLEAVTDTRLLHAPQPFILLARAILLAVESGKLDPDKTGSGVSYGERALRRVSSWNGSLSGGGKGKLLGGKCC